jgi:DNA repair ATPase RecN
MDEQMTALAKEVQDLRDRQLRDRHESIMRDDAIFRRMSIHDERMDFHAEMLQKTIAAVGECADTVTRLGQKIDLLVVRLDGTDQRLDALMGRMDRTDQRLDALIVRMDKTDERWSQLIDQLTREHQNGGTKQ